jgi:hypothetical protein
MPDESRKPDAIIMTGGWEPPGASSPSRIDRLCSYFEQALGAQAGQKAYLRSISQTQFLVTLSPTDTLLYPTGHRLEGQPRYDWREQTSGASKGLSFGYLKADPTQ